MGVYQYLPYERIVVINQTISNEEFMFKIIHIKFCDDDRTNFSVYKRKPKTKKKRIRKKWMKKYVYLVPDTHGCTVVGYDVNQTGDGVDVFAVAHPDARPFMEEMNSKNDGNQPKFVFVED